MKWLAILIALLVSCDSVAQYRRPVCNSPFCAMCNAIRANNAAIDRQQYAIQQPAVQQVVRSLPAGQQPTSYDVLAKIVPVLDLRSDDLLIDAGCGDGRVAVMAANATGCRAIGIELDANRVTQAKQLAAGAGQSDRVAIVQGDATQLDLYDQAVVYVYLWPETLNRLSPLLAKAKRVVSYQHDIPGLPTRRVTIATGHQLYVYER